MAFYRKYQQKGSYSGSVSNYIRLNRGESGMYTVAYLIAVKRGVRTRLPSATLIVL